MRKVDLAELKVGMVLAKDVPDFLGNVMFKAGEVLKTQHLKTLQQWGVKELYVQSEPNAARGSETRALKTNTVHNELEALERRFAGLTDQPLMKTIYEIQKGILQSRLEEGA